MPVNSKESLTFGPSNNRRHHLDGKRIVYIDSLLRASTRYWISEMHVLLIVPPIRTAAYLGSSSPISSISMYMEILERRGGSSKTHRLTMVSGVAIVYRDYEIGSAARICRVFFLL